MVSLHEIDVINSRSQGFLALFAGAVLVVLMVLVVMSMMVVVALCTIVTVGDMGGSEVNFVCTSLLGVGLSV